VLILLYGEPLALGRDDHGGYDGPTASLLAVPFDVDRLEV